MKSYTMQELKKLYLEFIQQYDDEDKVETYETARDSAQWAGEFLDWIEEKE